MWEIIENIAGVALILWVFELHRKVDRLTILKLDVEEMKREEEKQ